MGGKLRARRVQISTIAALSTLGIYTLVRLSTAPPSIPHVHLSPSKNDVHMPEISPARPGQAQAPIPPPIPDAALSPTDTTAATSSPPPILKPSKEPRPAPPGTQHPISYLISAAEEEMGKTVARQSKTLEQAVAEYRRRYGMPPPPRFDKWYAFAKDRGVRLPDEFDGVADLLTPFWGLRPATVRSRASEALGFAGNALLGVQVRRGAVAHMSGGSDWHRKAVSGMLASFVRHLPDMDLAFNVHDEPRVAVPHDDLARLVARARSGPMAAAAAMAKPKNDFSTAAVPATNPAENSSSSSSSSSSSDARPRPKGLAPEGGFDHVGTTRFNTYAHQSTWLHSRSSCGPDTPARALDDSERADDLSASLTGELGFVHNATALSDVCLSPSLATSFGFFERPNAFSVVQELFPIFSSSKISSYSDIVYPSPWYWYEKVAYDDAQDPGWQDKKAKMYWRGSTTGGYSRNGGWRMHHRQRMVDRINGNGDASQAKILIRGQAKGKGGGGGGGWEAKQMPRKRFSSLFDVSFSHVGQCDPADCDAQERYFSVKGRTRPETAWRYRHLLDVDGNGFSGRFYAFLRSRSLVYKLSVFREWHADWVRPWVHYVPMSMRGDEWLELVRFFSGDGGDEDAGDLGAEDGDVLGEKLALQGRDWANKALRNEDLEVWFFRLLLEYGRVVDDERESIGFSL
ncbi:hypothetical protein RB595_005665 [Gaeumannomyces hyphopodioides]